MSSNVAIIGAGQLGSRHLQGLANCATPLSIFLVDPSAASIATAQERFAAVPASKNHILHTVGAINDLPRDLELVIVACTADYRFGVYGNLLKYTEPRVILLEKVLFQDLDQYPQAIELAAASRSQTIVNLAQRYWPFFRILKSQVANKSELSITITGSNWGLGCNAVHNVDIAEFIWGMPGQTTARLDGALRESKRANCHEFTGTIETLIAGNEVARKQTFFRTEGGVIEGGFAIEEAAAGDLAARNFDWLTEASIAPDMTDPQNWDFDGSGADDTAVASQIDAEVGYCALDKGVTAGDSLLMTGASQVRTYAVYSFHDSRNGQSLMEVGYKRRF